ncbi:NAD(P)/FAD-dependent oxidoreductase [Xenophilus azovorans]|uniref:NAD(P)/FAD-dependent oxidoreductase n=1 Tax=Xenophilus azovorans TaxID=151755 RepID=UPI00056EB394|nr:FAD-dependent oxidoreductase [Xenophilus azovorans]
MNTTQGAVIVGAGQAGSEVASALRQQGYEGRIVLVGTEAHLPYRRPPLSKAYLAGQATTDSLHIKPRATYEKAAIELKLGCQVTAIDRAARRLALADGQFLGYDKLVLATGGEARRLPLPGASAPNVLYLRTLDDVAAIRAEFGRARTLIVIGGGYIGLEVAAVARGQGLDVTVVEAAQRVLGRVAAPQMSAFYEEVHREAGVTVRTGCTVEALEQRDGRVVAIRVAGGERIEADVVLVGIGLVPNVQIAKDAGLDVGDGILVDEHAATSDPDIYAVGDCANHPNDLLGRRLRLESVPNATEQARTVAASICGKPQPYHPVPWFWSDQYELKLQMAGISDGFDNVVLRGNPADRHFCAFYLRDGVLIAADAVNRAPDFMFARRLVAARVRAPAATLADPSIPLKALLPQ